MSSRLLALQTHDETVERIWASRRHPPLSTSDATTILDQLCRVPHLGHKAKSWTLILSSQHNLQLLRKLPLHSNNSIASQWPRSQILLLHNELPRLLFSRTNLLPLARQASQHSREEMHLLLDQRWASSQSPGWKDALLCSLQRGQLSSRHLP
jgi:hypothetical protein